MVPITDMYMQKKKKWKTGCKKMQTNFFYRETIIVQSGFCIPNDFSKCK